MSACGFYPYGEETRISLFNPDVFAYYGYAEFNYSSNSFGSFQSDTIRFPATYVEPNVQLWMDYCHGKVDLPSVYNAVYTLFDHEIDEQSPNAMIQYLYRQKDNDALNYLRFAKQCEFFNSWQDDPWERQTFEAMPKRTALMKKAISLAETVRSEELKRRYTFLAIRLAWYNHQYEQVKLLFDKAFKQNTNKDILYYWSLYFNSFTEADTALANVELAQVFAHAVDKRFVCHQHFHKEISLDRMLRLASSNEERANVYLLAGVEKHDKALMHLQKMYALKPASDGLSFLLLREINKIEDFVFTPYYTLFQPSLSYDYWSDRTEPSTQQILDRAERDRKYAGDVLTFVNRVDLHKVDHPEFWQTCKAYLQFITRDYNACLSLLDQVEKTTTDKAIVNQLHMIRALALTAKQTKGSAVIPTTIQSTLMANQKNRQFIFAIGKELEYLGNTSDAALLYSLLNKNWNDDQDMSSSYVLWKAKTFRGKSHAIYCMDYYMDYFDYMDAIYSPEQTLAFIEHFQTNQAAKDSFSVFKFGVMKDQLPRLYDLLGTKYIRQNKLEQALWAFEKAGSQYWNRAYTSWEDGRNVFDQSPFFVMKYTPSFISTRDVIRLNKYNVTKQLITYLRRANDRNEKDRDYYYFLAANAYYNFGHEGNAWMMRRFGGWSSYSLSVIEDEAEFRQSNLAKQYYVLAKQYAQTDKFKALCVRMAARCERHKIESRFIENWNDDVYHNYDSILATNKYYQDLKTTYSDYFDDLVSNCDHFGSYFDARR